MVIFFVLGFTGPYDDKTESTACKWPIILGLQKIQYNWYIQIWNTCTHSSHYHSPKTDSEELVNSKDMVWLWKYSQATKKHKGDPTPLHILITFISVTSFSRDLMAFLEYSNSSIFWDMSSFILEHFFSNSLIWRWNLQNCVCVKATKRAYRELTM